MTYGEFLDKQNSIYGNFRSATAAIPEVGISRDPGIEPQAGFVVAYLLDERVGEEVGEHSDRVANITPALLYGPDNAHVTVTTYNLRTGADVVIDPGDNDGDSMVLEQLARGVEHARDHRRDLWGDNLTVSFADMLSNGKTVVAAGTPNQSLWEFGQAVVAGAKQNGAEGSTPWGAHTTVSRFTETVTPESEEDAKRLEALRRALWTAQTLGQASVRRIGVGYFHTTPENGSVLDIDSSYEVGKVA